MSTHNQAVTSSHPTTHTLPESANRKPLAHLQEYLDEMRVCVNKLQALLEEVNKLLVVVKESVFVLALIVLFAWAVVQLFTRLH